MSKFAVAGGTGTVGRHVVSAAAEAGDDVVVLSRSAGIDLTSPHGLEARLEGVVAIIDVSNPSSLRAESAGSFFETATANLARCGLAAGVQRLVALSIIGIDQIPYWYYRAKLRHEAAVRSVPLQSSVVRATQFHEFPGQILSRTRVGPVAAVPIMRTQPIAARSVAELLLEVARSPSSEMLVQVAGPETHDLVDLARRVVRRRGWRVGIVPVPLPGRIGRVMRSGGLLPASGVTTKGPTFSSWLQGGSDAP
jgi:uncharacterized protein YbjT (DUF2867 family)